MEQYDDFGFPTADLTRRHQRRIKIRTFTTKNHWEAKYPSLKDALAAAADIKQAAEINSLIQDHGLLPAYRPHFYWFWCEAERKKVGCPSGDYAEVLKLVADIPEEVAKQIELDVPRTFCEQRDFIAASEARAGEELGGSRSAVMEHSQSAAVVASLRSAGQGTIHDALRRMLRAFCVLHPSDGYLQSMNFIAAFTLLVFGRENEDKAFWCFDFLCSVLLKGYYTRDMEQLHADCNVFRRVLSYRQPQLVAHLESLGPVDIASLFLPRWLLCSYLNCFPADIVVRVWDTMFLAGTDAPKVLLEVALAVVEMCEVLLLAAKSFADIAETLKDVGGHVTDSAELLLLTHLPTCTLASMSLHEWRSDMDPSSKVVHKVMSPSFTSGTKRRRSQLVEKVTSPMGSPKLIQSPEFHTPAARAKRTSLLYSTPGRTPPVSFTDGLDRLEGKLGTLPTFSPTNHLSPSLRSAKGRTSMLPLAADSANMTEKGCRSPLLKSPQGLFKSPLAAPSLRSPIPKPMEMMASQVMQTTGTATSSENTIPAKVEAATLPPAAAIGCILNPNTAFGLASARKKRQLAKQARGTGGKVPLSTRKSARKGPDAKTYSTMYSEYDEDAEDFADFEGADHASQMMTFAPPSAKRTRTLHAAPSADEECGLSFQMQMLSPKRSISGSARL